MASPINMIGEAFLFYHALLLHIFFDSSKLFRVFLCANQINRYFCAVKPIFLRL